MSIAADTSRSRQEGRSPVPGQSCSVIPSGTPAERLTDDLVVEILSRVSAKVVCRSKCVSKHWLGLINHPDHRKRLPQTLAGFFYGSNITGHLPFHFTSVSGDRRPPFGTSFTFLPNHHLPVDLLDSCNGLLLCRCYHVSDGVGAFQYVVCNPATEKWAVLPNSGKATDNVAIICLGFDPALSSHFHVFELVVEHNYSQDTDLSGVAVYSSETGEWVYKEERWIGEATWLAGRHSSTAVFLDGLLFFSAFDPDLYDCVAAVDTKGETWMKFRAPSGQVDDGFIHLSQGHLHFANFQRDNDGVAIRFVVYVLENYQTGEWILKHGIETSNMFGWTDLCPDGGFDFIAIHLECNLVFFAADGIILVCYNMDNRRVKVISYLADVKPLSFLPYVPLYT
ncbi:F-box protein At5g07610-like [Triticum aestivum]|uniref:F-box protein At5g07610-like n=1 Tax=Triticum aestivum TaxID=4565 RepID=UPI001D02BEC3|nr:F-box protein At5g07610-like [Triticum aestivum]